MSINWNKMLRISTIFLFILFSIVIFYVDPMIDGKDGSGVIALQLSFFVDRAIEVVNSWGIGGAYRFKKYIFTDYIYAIAYVLFFVSVLKVLIHKKRASNRYNFFVYFAILAGILDWVENSIEIAFVSNMQNFSEILFFLHSVISVIKWSALPIVLIGIFMLIFKENK